MKKHQITLTLFSIILLAFISCKDPVTAENVIYEGDLYKLYLTEEINKTTINLKNLNTALKQTPNNSKLQKEKIKSQNTLDAINQRASLQDSNSSNVSYIIRKRRPMPIPPRPCTGTSACMPANLLKYFTISKDISRVTMKIKDTKTNKLITTISIDQSTALAKYNNDISAKKISFTDYKGEVTIDVERTNINNETVSYTISGNII